MMAKKKLRRSPREKTYKDRDLDFEACSEEYKPFKTAWEIAAMYVIVGSTWILLSDRILYAIPLSSELLSSISMVKGWGYVLATGILLFIVIYKSFNKIRRINQILLANYEELIATDQELQEKIQRLEQKITRVEEEILRLEHQMCRPKVYSDPGEMKRLNMTLKQLKEELALLYKRWEETVE